MDNLGAHRSQRPSPDRVRGITGAGGYRDCPRRLVERAAAHRGRADLARRLLPPLCDRVQIRQVLGRGCEHARGARERIAGDRDAAGSAEEPGVPGLAGARGVGAGAARAKRSDRSAGHCRKHRAGDGQRAGSRGVPGPVDRTVGRGCLVGSQQPGDAFDAAGGAGGGGGAAGVQRRSVRLQQGAPRVGAATQHRSLHVQSGSAAFARQRVLGQLCRQLRDQATGGSRRRCRPRWSWRWPRWAASRAWSR